MVRVPDHYGASVAVPCIGREDGGIRLRHSDTPSRAAEFHHRALAEPDVRLAPHPAGGRPNTLPAGAKRPATLWNASNIYAPNLVIAGAYDTWSFPEDREGLMRHLVHAPVKKSVLNPNATHFVLFEKPRFAFFEEILKFLKEFPSPPFQRSPPFQGGLS